MRGLPASVWRLTFAYSLMMAGTSLLVLVAGIIGTEIAPLPGFATLPVACAVIGLACSTLPTGRLLDLLGRRRVFIAYGLVACCGAGGAAYSVAISSFWLFCLAAFVMGWSAAAGHQYRFAALEAVEPEQAAKATSLLLLGGIMAAVIGPELAVRGRDILPTPFAGSFLLLILSYSLGMILVAQNRNLTPPVGHGPARGRTMWEILRQPAAMLAIGAAAAGYGMMSLVMTATPISMHLHSHHDLEATKVVIQIHIAAMYLPSLLFPLLLRRFGMFGMMALGIAVMLGCLAVAFTGEGFLEFWLSLALLGIGWNFLFLAGTNLLPRAYRPEERFRAQSMNDFIVFSIQACASLGAGGVLYLWGWHGVLWACVPILGVFSALLLRYRKVLPGDSESGTGEARGGEGSRAERQA